VESIFLFAKYGDQHIVNEIINLEVSCLSWRALSQVVGSMLFLFDESARNI
jgi:hypothetical protein